jgi:hypothetical protein
MALPRRACQIAAFPQTGFHQTANQGCSNPTSLFRRKRQISFTKTAITVQPKAPSYIYKEVQVIQYNHDT